MSGQAGARWIARELYEIGAAENSHSLAEGSVIQHDRSRTSEQPPQTYPLIDRLSQRSLDALKEIYIELVREGRKQAA